MTTCVVLAAGRSSRFPGNKLLHDLPGGTLLERALRACRDYPVVAVCSAQVADAARREGVAVIVNEHPERGMSYSLRLAHDRIDVHDAIAVLPADLLQIEPEDLAQVIESANGFDVAYPMRSDGTPGHPVVFSARAREGIPALQDGAPISALRDNPNLKRRILSIEQPWPYRDVDRESDLPG